MVHKFRFAMARVRNFSMKTVIKFFGFVVLLFGTIVFGFLGQPTEMALTIVASSMALVFSDIERFKKVKGAGFEAEMRDQIEAIIDKETEPTESEDSKNTSPLTATLDRESKAILNAIDSPKYTWRYQSGIMKGSKIGRDVALKKLAWLVEHGFVRRSVGKYGTIWSLTEQGRHMVVIEDFDNLDEK